MSEPANATRPLQIAGSASPTGLRRSEHRAILQAGDAVLALGSAAVVWAWSERAPSIPALEPVLGGAKGSWFWVAVLWWLLLAPSRRIGIASSLSASLRWLAWAAFALLLVFGALRVYFQAAGPWDAALARFLATAPAITLAGRLVYRGLFLGDRFRRRAVILGLGDSAERALAAIKRAAPDTRVVAFVDERESGPARELEGLPVVPGRDGLERLIAEGIGEIVVAGHTAVDDRLLQLLIQCQESGIEVVRSRTVNEHLLGRIPVDEVEADWLLSSFADTIRLRDESDIARRSLDVIAGLAGCFLLLVSTPAVALAIWLDDGRPIFFRQTRTGRAGRPFALLKFRTMIRSAEAGGPRWATQDDSRVTRAGRFLRRSRLDELPQFLNVLAGHMSLVGPRPERPEFVARLEEAIPFYRVRLMVRPGLTGWAQVNCPYGDSVDDARLKLEYDLYYIRHRSIWFDLRIVSKTVLTVARLGGL